MATWSDDELRRIEEAEELELASVRSDDTFRSPVIMWVVRHGDDITCAQSMAAAPRGSAALRQKHEARIEAGGVTKDVSLVETDELLDEVDAAYGAKYGRRYPSIVPSIIGPEARAAQLKLVPSEEEK